MNAITTIKEIRNLTIPLQSERLRSRCSISPNVLSGFIWSSLRSIFGLGYYRCFQKFDRRNMRVTNASQERAHVAGLVALYLQGFPTPSPATVQGIIVSNSTGGVVTNPGTGSPNLLAFSPPCPPVGPASTSRLVSLIIFIRRTIARLVAAGAALAWKKLASAYQVRSSPVR